MVSKRARVGRNLGTRINDLDSRAMTADIKSRTSDIDVDDITSRIESLEAETSNLNSPNYRAEQDAAYLGNERATAILDAAYVGPGPANVYFTLAPSFELNGPYEWKGQYYPWGNRVVNMVRQNGTWFIEGHTGEMMNPEVGNTQGYGGVGEIKLLNGWKTYSEYNGSNTYVNARMQKLSSGIVVLSGLIQGGTLTSGTTIATLPVGMRPDSTMIFASYNGGNWRGVGISTSGNIYPIINMADSYISLDGIAFPAAGTATWTDLTLANGYTAYNPTTYGNPGYWKDGYGFVWFRGMLVPGTTTSDTVMATLPESVQPFIAEHHTAVSSNAYGCVGASSAGLLWKTGNTGTTYISLANTTIVTSAAMTGTNNWFTPTFQNGWLNYGTSHTSFGLLRRGDGLGMAKGLVRSGTVGSNVRIATIPPRISPSMTCLFPRPAAGAAGRIDVWGHRMVNTDAGMTNLNSGNNGWVSYDGMKWLVGENT